MPANMSSPTSHHRLLHLPHTFSFWDGDRALKKTTSLDIDVRETKTDYWVDISLPGVSDSNSVYIEWLSNRQLSLSGKIERPPIGEGLVADSSEEPINCLCRQLTPEPSYPAEVNGAGTESGQNGTIKKEEKPESHDKEEATYLVAERRLGWYHRTIAFPVDVDPDSIIAKLRYGLLTIKVPKLDVHNQPPKKRIHVTC